jgi:hypothetical protein
MLHSQQAVPLLQQLLLVASANKQRVCQGQLGRGRSCPVHKLQLRSEGSTARVHLQQQQKQKQPQGHWGEVQRQRRQQHHQQ